MNYKLTSDKTDISAADGLIWTLVNRRVEQVVVSEGLNQLGPLKTSK